MIAGLSKARLRQRPTLAYESRGKLVPTSIQSKDRCHDHSRTGTPHGAQAIPSAHGDNFEPEPLYKE